MIESQRVGPAGFHSSFARPEKRFYGAVLLQGEQVSKAKLEYIKI
jgi:hypothetical protein